MNVGIEWPRCVSTKESILFLKKLVQKFEIAAKRLIYLYCIILPLVCFLRMEEWFDLYSAIVKYDYTAKGSQ